MYDRYPLDQKLQGSTKSDVYLEYAEVYKSVIRFLLEKSTEEPSISIHYYSLAPILFLLRHYIELQLKGIIIYKEWRPPKDQVPIHHDIALLYREANNAIDKKYGLDMLGKPNKDVERFINSLGKFDRNGQAFRYPETSRGEEFSEKLVKLEEKDPWLYKTIISKPKLIAIAKAIIGDLEGMEGYLDNMWNNEQESFENI